MRKLLGVAAGLLVALVLSLPGVASAQAVGTGQGTPSPQQTLAITPSAANQVVPLTYSTANVNVGVSWSAGWARFPITSNAWVVYPGQKVYLVYKVIKPTGGVRAGTSFTLSPCTGSSTCSRTPTVTTGTGNGCWKAGTWEVRAWGYSSPNTGATVEQRSNVAAAIWTIPTRTCLA